MTIAVVHLTLNAKAVYPLRFLSPKLLSLNYVLEQIAHTSEGWNANKIELIFSSVGSAEVTKRTETRELESHSLNYALPPKRW